MRVERDVRRIDTAAEFQPTKSKLWIPEKERIETPEGSFFKVQSLLTQYLPNDGVWDKTTFDVFPTSTIPQLVTGVDENFEWIINEPVLQQMYLSFGYEITYPPIETPPTP